MSRKDLFLKDIFNRAQEALPDMLRDTKPLAGGAFGLAVTHADDSITKLCFRPQNPQWEEKAIAGMNNEIAAMRILDGGAVPGLRFPKLLEEPVTFADGGYVGAYRMTRVPGRSWLWYENDRPPADKPEYFAQAGRVLAQFQAALDAKYLSGLRQEMTGRGQEVPVVLQLSDKINAGLEAADRYLKAHMTAGAVHGDFHGGNIMIDADDRICGLIDFSMTGRVGNRGLDMISAPAGLSETLIKAYEAESGQEVDRHVMSAMHISMWAHFLKENEPEPDAFTQAVTQINRHLNDMVPATGIKP